MRKLASIQRITALDPIPKADFIEVAQVQGWQVVVQKSQNFKVGDLVVYFEIDSILPDKPWCEFMRDRKFRVKTIKLRKQVSQGLCIPLVAIFPKLAADGHDFAEGEDLTVVLGVEKHDPQAAKEAREYASGKSKRKQPHTWMLRWKLGRALHQKLYPRASGSWPEWFPKTDETRVQNLVNIGRAVTGRLLYATEKLDGQSCTFFYKRDEKVGLLSRGLFGVCSRNIWYKNKAANNWWNMAEQLGVEEALRNFCLSETKSIAIQGEIVGEGIQGNRYGIKGHEFFVFNVYDINKGKYLNSSEKLRVVKQLGLMEVPLIHLTFSGDDEPCADFLLDYSEGGSVLKKEVEREGLVFRDVRDDSFSFKAISNKFLLEGSGKDRGAKP